MAKLDKKDSAQILSLMEHKGWDTLIKLVAMTISDLNARKSSGTNAFETLRSLHTREGKVDGLTEFFEGLDRGESLTSST